MGTNRRHFALLLGHFLQCKDLAVPFPVKSNHHPSRLKMNIIVNVLLILGIYFFLGLLVLTPFVLSARISRWEEKNHRTNH